MSRIQLSIKTTTGKRIGVQVEGSDTLDFVKTKIEHLAECVIDNSDLRFEVMLKVAAPKRKRECCEHPISVCFLPENRTITLEIPPSETIYNLFEMIKEEEGVSPYDYSLYFAGMPLQEDPLRTTLAHYNIYEGSIIHLVRYPVGGMTISVETTDGKTIFLEDVRKYLYIREVKAMIEDKAGIPADKQRLVYAGEELQDSRGVGECRILKGSTLRLVDDDEDRRRKERTRRINVELIVAATRKKRIIQLNVDSTDTIREVKAKIQAEEGISTGQQVLYLPQKRLQDGFTLADYYIQNDTTLYLAQIRL